MTTNIPSNPLASVHLSRFFKVINPAMRPNIQWIKGAALAFSVAVLGTSSLGLPAQATFAEDIQNKSAAYVPPPEAGTPEPTGGTGSRGGCEAVSERPPLAALVGQRHLKLTTSDRPVFWIYVPYTPKEAPSGFLSLQQGDNAIYEGTFSLATTSELSTPGIVGIRLPESAPSLVAGQEYDWYIDINCVDVTGENVNSVGTPANLYGSVQRVEVTEGLARDLLQSQTGLDVVAAYGKHHIWYEWLTELARLRLDSDNNVGLSHTELNSAELENTWTTVLSDQQTVLLDSWASEPLVGEIVPAMLQSDNLESR
ncbi:MAG: DUF928 domain-containing protein [Cyanobacteria bacterium P01_F01_bin.150]